MRLLSLAGLMCLAGCVINPSERESGPPPLEPLKLYGRNPNYLEFRQQPVILVTSAEHYGALINRDFDYPVYLSALQRDGLNYTRIFTGAYVEQPGSFGIEHNSLAPGPGRFIAPWARSDQPGYAGGGNRFDLARWDEEYFSRLKDFVRLAGESGVFVEVTLFSSYYGPNWELSPLHPANNVNGTPNLPHQEVQAAENEGLFGYQEAMVRKIVRELNEFDNVFFEIQNEPWADNGETVAPVNPYLLDWREVWQNRVDLARQPSLDWQARMAAAIQDEEKALPKKHLIAQNFCNFGYPVSPVPDMVSILNFHYAYPAAVSMNLELNRVVGFDESGFSGSDDEPYRKQAWKFLLSGGGLFNNLDYSFYPGSEDGAGSNRAPGGGGQALRRQLGILAAFISAADFTRMRPLCSTEFSCPGVLVFGMSSRGREYVFYLNGKGPTSLSLYVPGGRYSTVWLDPLTGERREGGLVEGTGSNTSISVPKFSGEIALHMKRVND